MPRPTRRPTRSSDSVLETLVARIDERSPDQRASDTVPSGFASLDRLLAGGLQHAGRAKLIGRNTAGNIETLLSHEFEDGSRLWLAEETFRLPNGTNWEGVGVTPDIRIDIGWDEYTADNDPVIAEAVMQLSR